jgi:hypothetical protein
MMDWCSHASKRWFICQRPPGHDGPHRAVDFEWDFSNQDERIASMTDPKKLNPTQVGQATEKTLTLIQRIVRWIKKLRSR